MNNIVWNVSLISTIKHCCCVVYNTLEKEWANVWIIWHMRQELSSFCYWQHILLYYYSGVEWCVQSQRNNVRVKANKSNRDHFKYTRRQIHSTLSIGRLIHTSHSWNIITHTHSLSLISKCEYVFFFWSESKENRVSVASESKAETKPPLKHNTKRGQSDWTTSPTLNKGSDTFTFQRSTSGTRIS
jgi:hypothetical protein